MARALFHLGGLSHPGGALGRKLLLRVNAHLPQVEVATGVSMGATQAWVWSVVLVVGFFTIIGLARAGVIVFWHVQPLKGASGPGSGAALLAPVWVFMALTIALAVAASPVKRYTDAAAAQLAQIAYVDPGQIYLGGHSTGGTLALRIFEPRYLAMVRDCSRDGRPFGVTLLLRGRESGR